MDLSINSLRSNESSVLPVAFKAVGDAVSKVGDLALNLLRGLGHVLGMGITKVVLRNKPQPMLTALFLGMLGISVPVKA
ncbi:hypothetical protein K0U07_03760 [bacterium]|nr:hypothetical protein [bacterium]